MGRWPAPPSAHSCPTREKAPPPRDRQQREAAGVCSRSAAPLPAGPPGMATCPPQTTRGILTSCPPPQVRGPHYFWLPLENWSWPQGRGGTDTLAARPRRDGEPGSGGPAVHAAGPPAPTGLSSVKAPSIRSSLRGDVHYISTPVGLCTQNAGGEGPGPGPGWRCPGPPTSAEIWETG